MKTCVYFKRASACAAVLSMLLAGCGGGGDDPPPVLLAGTDTVTLTAGQNAQLLSNDTVGSTVASLGASGNVTFSVVTGTLPVGITVDGGQLSVSAAAVPGSATISYRICETLRPSNCANGEARVTVPAPPIVAVADAFTLAAGGADDALKNDTLGGVAASGTSVATTTTGALPAGVEVSAAGVLSVGTSAAPGQYDLSYNICQKVAPSNCATASIRLTVLGLGTVSGRAVDAATGVGIAGVSVRAGTVIATTDAGGGFSITNVPAADRLSVYFDGPNHAESARIAEVRASANTDVQVRMAAVGVSTPVDVAAGGTVSLSASPARVVLLPNSVQRADGSVPTGNMTVKLTAIDPASDSSVMPGDFTALQGGSAVPIESFGAINVRLADAAGAALNLRPGQTATIRIPVASRSESTPSTIPLFYFHNSTGRWVQEGTATLTSSGSSSYYEGTVSHFTTWNADQVYNTVRVLGCLADAAGVRVAGGFLQSDGVDYSGTSSAITDSAGNFSLAIRANSVATVVGLSAGKLTNTLRVGPSAADITLPACLSLGQAGAGLTMKLTWGALPRDLDSHLFTPSGAHIDYGSKGSLLAAPFANLDVDDTNSYGPEVVTITKLMVGTYKYSIFNYSGYSAGPVTDASARVELNIPGRAVELFVPPSGETSATRWWNLFEFDVDASCNIVMRRVGTFSAATPTTASAAPQYCTP